MKSDKPQQTEFVVIGIYTPRDARKLLQRFEQANIAFRARERQALPEPGPTAGIDISVESSRASEVGQIQRAVFDDTLPNYESSFFHGHHNISAMHPRATELIVRLDLQPHPEGGFYRQIFRSSVQIDPMDGRGSRAALTTIYFLLTQGNCSRWHQVASDEVWHLYEGGPLELLELTASGQSVLRHRLAPVGSGTDAPVCTIAAGVWQAARPLGEYAFVGCTVGPG
ncbi:MAG TPA: cupin domain-containing protein, partial [Candidatus Udaeobacter sp.]|nr:cupin domain-containing protein [Candidatus Udaeobacter sp.]